MSILKSSAEDLTLNADGSGNDIIFQSNGSTKVIVTAEGNVGIGTSSPNNPLHINGGASDTALHITNNATGTTSTDGFNITVENPSPDVVIRNRESTNMRFLTANTERMRIDSSGNVGIGVTPESWHSSYTALELKGGAALWSYNTSTEANTFLSSNAFYDGSHKYIADGEAVSYFQTSSGKHEFNVATSGSADGTITWTTAMTIANGGDVYMGDTTPWNNSGNNGAWKIGADGGADFARHQSEVINVNRLGNDGNAIVFRKDGTAVGSIGNTGTDLKITGTDDIFFNVAGASNNILQLYGGSSANNQSKFDSHVNPLTDNSKDLGNATERWKDLYLSGNVVIGTAGKGIDFSAQTSTTSGTVTSGGEVLDHYEEGTWTPTIARSTTAPTLSTYTEQAGTYIKIGKLVYVTCSLRMDGIRDGAGNWQIAGLPFTGQVVSQQYTNLTAGYNYINGQDKTVNGQPCRWQLNYSDKFSEYSSTSTTTHTSSVFRKGFTGCYVAA